MKFSLENKLTLKVIIFPSLKQIQNSSYKSATPQNLILDSCKDANVKCYNLLEQIPKYLDKISVESLFVDNLHFSPEGHKLMARMIYELR